MELLTGVNRALAKGHRDRLAAPGFTLVEILVTLVILGIATALVSLRLFEGEREQGQRQVQQVAAALEHAALVAEWRNRSILWRWQDQGPRFDILARNGEDWTWQPLTDEAPLAARAPLNGLRLVHFERSGQRDAEPYLLFAAHGINDPFAIHLELGQFLWRVSGDALGRVRVESQ